MPLDGRFISCIHMSYMSLRATVHTAVLVGYAALFAGGLAHYFLGSYWWTLAGVAGFFLCNAHNLGIMVAVERLPTDDEIARELMGKTAEEPKA